MRNFLAISACMLSLLPLTAVPCRAQTGLRVTYGNSGVQNVTSGSDSLEDLATYPSDAFHIWHMKMTDLKGNVISQGQYGWGENNNGRSWDPATKTWTYNFVWGSISVHFQQVDSRLDMTVTETNLSTSGVILDGATIYPFALHLPHLPNKFYDPGYAQLSFNTTGPSVMVADYGSGEVVAVAPDASKPLYSGFMPTGNGVAYYPVISSTSPDGLATFQPHNDRPVQPGQSDTFTVSLRFAPAGTAATALAADAYASWSKTWPSQLKWTDHRPIGTIFLASSPSGNINQPGGYPNNPRRYFNDSNASNFDTRTMAGLSAFQARVLQQAAAAVANLTMLGAQGAITWDIEGEQYPQETSYVCSPDTIASTAPEMESIIKDRNSRYYGQKLDDAYFKTISSAGFRVGVCIRPQHFAINKDGTAQQTYLASSSVEAEMLRKMQYAHTRWGATLFYVDSTVESNGAVLDAGIFQRLAQALPDSLIMPEESTPRHYAYTAPFQTFLFHGDLGTDATVRSYYPTAFSVNLINDVSSQSLAASTPQLTASVQGGDILMGLAGFWQANDPTIVAIYKAAGSAPPVAPVPPPVVPPVTTPDPVTPPVVPPVVASPPVVKTSAVSIIAPGAGETITGAVTINGNISINLDAAGSYLMVDGMAVGTRRVTGSPFLYPLDTTSLSNGTHTLQLWAHDIGNNTTISPTVTVTVQNSVTPVIPVTAPPAAIPVVTPPAPADPAFPIAMTYPLTGQGVSGTVQVAGAIGQTLDAAGSYLLVDGAEYGTRRVVSPPYVYALDTTLLTAGKHVIQIWAHDIANNNLLSNPTTIIVGNN